MPIRPWSPPLSFLAGLITAACAPIATLSTLIPARPNASRMTCLPATTPIDPVIVPGSATTASQGMAM